MAALNGNHVQRSEAIENHVRLDELGNNNSKGGDKRTGDFEEGSKSAHGFQNSKAPRMDSSDTIISGGGSTTNSRRAYISVCILFIINLLNYMDRFTIAGVLTAVKTDFDMNDAQAGLLQTVFVCAYMIFAPIFGFLGDRYSRKWIMIVGVSIWSSAVLLSTFVPAHWFLLFLFCRGVVGIGEASYSTVACTLIADLFTKDMRSRMLMLFYFAIPVGSGFGFIIGSGVAGLFSDPNVGWRWGVRVTPLFGIVCLLLLIFVLQEPRRGESEHSSESQSSSWRADLMFLMKNRSFLWSTLGFTCVAFAAGSLSWWGPTFIEFGERTKMQAPDKAFIGLIFGVIAALGGFIGVSVGSLSAQYWRRTNPKADPLVCAIGVLLCVPFLYSALTFPRVNQVVSWISVFLAVTCLSLNWAITADILLYVIPPTRRSTASAFQMLFSHLLGDATSPYIVGLVSDKIRGDSMSDVANFQALQYAMYIPDFVLILGGFFFLGTAWYVEHDRKASELLAKGAAVGELSANSSITSHPAQMGGYGGLTDVVGDIPTVDSRAQLISPDDETLPDTNVQYRL